MDRFSCYPLLLLLLAIAACCLATPTHDKLSGLLVQKPALNLPDPAQLLSGLPEKFMKSKPVFVKPVVVKPIVVVKPVVIGGGPASGGGGGGGGGQSHGHGHGHGHHGKVKFFGKFKY